MYMVIKQLCMVTCNTGRMRSSTLHVPALYAQVVYTTLIDSLVAWTFAASNASEQLSGFTDFQEETWFLRLVLHIHHQADVSQENSLDFVVQIHHWPGKLGLQQLSVWPATKVTTFRATLWPIPTSDSKCEIMESWNDRVSFPWPENSKYWGSVLALFLWTLGPWGWISVSQFQ